jgi:hypothetical protein
VWTLRGLRPGRTTFYSWGEDVLGGGREGVVCVRRGAGEGVKVQNFYGLTKCYISFVCTLGGNGGSWGRERDGLIFVMCIFDTLGKGGVFFCFFFAFLIHFTCNQCSFYVLFTFSNF